MANRWAVGNGNYNTPATWNDPGGGATVPSAGDDVYSNNYTVQLDIDVVANTLRNTAASGINAGGAFAYSGAASRSVTATNGFYNASTNILNITIPLGYTITITGDLYGTGRWFNWAGAGNINYTGNLLNGWTGGYNGGAIYSSNTGVVNIVGNLNPGSYFAAGAQYNNWAFYNAGVGTANLTGAMRGNNNGYCVVNASTGALTLVGTAMSGGTALGYAIYSTTAGYVTLIGIADTQTPPTTVTPAIYLTVGTVYLAALVYNRSSTLAIFAPKIVLLSSSPTSWLFVNEIAGTKTLYTTDTGMFGYPAIQNVRNATVFGHTNEFVGTLKVPTAAQVLLGVQIDATTGTLLMTPADFWNMAEVLATAGMGLKVKNNLDVAVSSRSTLTAAQVWAELTANITTPSSIGELVKTLSTVPADVWKELLANITTPNSIGVRLKDCATVPSTGAQISNLT